MKKLLIVVLALLFALSASACGNAEKEASETESEDTGSMVMITDDTEFAGKTGMAVDTSLVPVHGMARYIIDDEIVYFIFAVQEDETEEPCNVLLKATKNAELKDDLTGFQTAGTPLADEEHAGIKVSRKEISADDTVYQEYDFEKDGIYYVLLTRGELSEEMFESLFASFLEAVRPA